MEIKDAIRSLVQQCNIESITTKDLAKELSNLYDETAVAETSKKRIEEHNSELKKRLETLKKELEDYKSAYVTPVDEIALTKKHLEQDKFKFSVEKEYAKREVEIYKEIVRALTCTKIPNENYYGGTGGTSWSKNMTIDKPSLPGAPFQEIK